ncbi:TPA: HNH endonuclease [Escherichia coli]
MNSKIKFEYIKRNWELRDGIVYSRRTGNPVSFSCKVNGRRYTKISVNGKPHAVLIYEGIFMLFHDRAIAEDKEVHHRDGNYENNSPDNLIELTDKQHRRIHQFLCDDPLRGIRLYEGAWQFRWTDDNGRQRSRRFHSIDEAMTFRAEIERPRRQELRALGLNCKRVSSGEKSRAITASKIYFLRTETIL